jgi:hypothetical protein
MSSASPFFESEEYIREFGERLLKPRRIVEEEQMGKDNKKKMVSKKKKKTKTARPSKFGYKNRSH